MNCIKESINVNGQILDIASVTSVVEFRKVTNEKTARNAQKFADSRVCQDDPRDLAFTFAEVIYLQRSQPWQATFGEKGQHAVGVHYPLEVIGLVFVVF